MTIAVDTSALLAILFREDDAADHVSILKKAELVLIGAPTVFELKLVLHRGRKRDLEPAADLLLQAPGVDIVPFIADHVTVATEALRRFGGRPARLNYGDCMTYAVAKVAGCPLLYKGGDFALTDVAAAR